MTSKDSTVERSSPSKSDNSDTAGEKIQIRLPTIFSLQSDMGELVPRIIREKIRIKAPMTAVAPSHIVHDGMTSEIFRADGSNSEVRMASHSAIHETSVKDHIHFELEKFELVTDAIAEQFAKSMSEHFISVFEETTKQTGQIFDGAGKRIEDSILDVLEKMPATESEDDRPYMIVSPFMADKISELQGKAQDPETDKRFLDIMEKKRLERIAREAGRKLVG